MRKLGNRKLLTTPSRIQDSVALILAGGRGTRLREAFSSGPKSMAPVGGHPFLEYLFSWLRSAGIPNLILCVGYKSAHIRNWFGDGRDRGLDVRYSQEIALLGTGGALKLAQGLVSTERFFVVNGDTFFDVNLEEMYRFHLRRRALATIAVAQVRCSARYGTVRLDSNAQITEFLEKKEITSRRRSPHMPVSSQSINGGVYLFEKKVFDFIPSCTVISLEKQIFPTLIGNGLYGFRAPGYFIDIGIPSALQQANNELRERCLIDH